ncbi:hypothetical protein LI055_10485 [Clostridium perfringens]|uniref:hypothetical protein n=1 Tax=Clostridium perfringens TaxID=1502 RepID=UPI002248390E|nr:hypothetical protein [Clostridium perfringens]MCX0380046.1 hypothetical protein [Clostridium perfringens]
MTYDELINLYPWFDLFWELFKGIVPTAVALLAIYINDRLAIKREKKKNEKDIKIKALKNLQIKAIEINDMMFCTSKSFLEYMLFLDDKEMKDEKRKIFYQQITNTIMNAKYLMMLSDIEYDNTKIESILFDECFLLISTFNRDIEKIINDYNEKAKRTSEKNKEVLLEQVQEELLIASAKIEKEIINYIKTLSFKIMEINEA